MTDPDKQDLLNDLWGEGEAALRETSLRRMIAEGRRKRHQRGMVKAVIGAAVVVASGVLLQPYRLLPPVLVRAPEEPPHISVRHLTEAEARDRLSGFAVAYAGPPGARRVVLLEPAER